MSIDEVIRTLEAQACYLEIKQAVDGSRALAICFFMIISSTDEFGYDDRWCYHSLEAASQALAVWDGRAGTEPEGWHRHPSSGRRRPEGKATKEFVLP